MTIRGNKLPGYWGDENMSFPGCFTSLIAVFTISHLACINTSAKYQYRSTWAMLTAWKIVLVKGMDLLGYESNLETLKNFFKRKYCVEKKLFKIVS